MLLAPHRPASHQAVVSPGERGRVLLVLQVPALDIVARTLAVYVLVLIGLRATGKREVGQMTPFDLVVVLLIANAVQNAMVGPDTSLTGGLIAAAVLLAANYALALASDRIPWLRRAVEGAPTLLIHDGHLITANLRAERVDPDEVLMALREHGVDRIEDVQLAVLEIDGSISVVQRDQDEAITHTRRRIRQRHHN
jgi:uncharacterized membrane protein YcaP (DUF421 family)